MASYTRRAVRWAKRQAKMFAMYAPLYMSLINDASLLSEHTLERRVKEVSEYTMRDWQAKKQHAESEGEKLHVMVPYNEGGVLRLYDMSHLIENPHYHRNQVAISRLHNGLYAISGPRKYFQMVGGRAELNQFYQNMQDGQFFHDAHRK